MSTKTMNQVIANYFKSFRLDPFTIDWNDEIGFAQGTCTRRE